MIDKLFKDFSDSRERRFIILFYKLIIQSFRGPCQFLKGLKYFFKLYYDCYIIQRFTASKIPLIQRL